MAVTLLPDDLIQPIGELSDVLFPDGNLLNMLSGWLVDATNQVNAAPGIALANQNKAAAAWVYYRAYSLVADRLASTPSNIVIDSTVTRTMASDQRKYFADKAKEWLDYYFSQNITTPIPDNPVFFRTVKAQRFSGYSNISN